MTSNLVELSHELTADFFRGGRFLYAIDATLGGGGDALFLSELLLPYGKIFGFDIQKLAVDRARLLFDNKTELLEAYCANHADMELLLPDFAKGKISCAFFNLGWLPDSDKRVVTRADSTLKALESVLKLIDKTKSALSVLSYRGHDGGCEEFAAVSDFFESNLKGKYEVFKGRETPTSPVLFFAEFQESQS